MLSGLVAISNPRRLIPVILTVAFLLRIPGIFWGLPIIDKYAHSYHPDEPKIIYGAMAFPEAIFENEDLRYPTALHYFVGMLVLPLDALTASSQLSELQFQTFTFIVARFVSIAHGVAAVALVYLFGKQHYNTRAGLLAAALLSVSLYHARHSSIATTDVTTSFWVMAVLFTLYRLSPGSRYRDYFFLGILTGLLAGVKYSGGIIVVAIAIVFVGLLARANNRGEKEHIITGSLLTAPIAIITFLFTTPTILVNPNALITSLQFESMRLGNRRLPLWDLRPIETDYRLLVMVVGLPLALLMIYGIAISLKKSVLRVNLPLVMTVFAYIFYFWGSMLARYFILILPVMCLLAAGGIEPLLRAKSRYLRWGVVSALVIVLGYSLIYNIAGIALVLDDTRSEASAYIQENVPEGSTVGYWFTGNTIRGGWALPSVDTEIYQFTNNLTQPEYVILTSQNYKAFERALSSSRLSEEYVWDPQFAHAWYRGIIPDPEVFEFYDYFLNGVGDKYNYELLVVFDRSIDVPIEFPPPEIRIYKRVDN